MQTIDGEVLAPADRADRLLEDVETTLSAVGGVAYLTKCAEETPAAFLALVRQAMTLRKLSKAEKDMAKREESFTEALQQLAVRCRQQPVLGEQVRSSFSAFLEEPFEKEKEKPN